MDDLISRQTAINEMKIRRHSAYEWYVTAKSKDDEEIMIRADSALASFIECILTIKKLPSVEAVEVVRCKDCIYHEPGTEELDAWCNVWGNTTICDGYCFYGERKNDG